MGFVLCSLPRFFLWSRTMHINAGCHFYCFPWYSKIRNEKVFGSVIAPRSHIKTMWCGIKFVGVQHNSAEFTCNFFAFLQLKNKESQSVRHTVYKTAWQPPVFFRPLLRNCPHHLLSPGSPLNGFAFESAGSSAVTSWICYGEPEGFRGETGKNKQWHDATPYNLCKGWLAVTACLSAGTQAKFFDNLNCTLWTEVVIWGFSGPTVTSDVDMEHLANVHCLLHFLQLFQISSH